MEHRLQPNLRVILEKWILKKAPGLAILKVAMIPFSPNVPH